jgi:hypothetical protein
VESEVVISRDEIVWSMFAVRDILAEVRRIRTRLEDGDGEVQEDLE